MNGAKTIPDAPAEWLKPHSGRPIPAADLCYDLELITPLFGGGAQTRTPDQDLPIRPTSIRGQLQFWWRATVGATSSTVQDLRQAQTALWGNTEVASSVELWLETYRAGSPQPCASFERDWKDPNRYRSMPTWNPPFGGSALPYALFPFQGQLGSGRTRIEVEPARCILQASFRLCLRCPPQKRSEVEQVVRTWVVFGGLGSRTRRGCGSIRCKTLDPKDRQDLIGVLQSYRQDQPVRDWPTLAKAILIGPENTNPLAAWNEVISLLRDFRQGVGLGRNPGQDPKRPGRSRWPEPETIRRVTQQRHFGHQPLSRIPSHAFPRAEFGLPIVFHFKDKGDPQDTVLYPGPGSNGSPRDRMASPLILKAVALQNGRYVPMIVCLRVPELTEVDLRRNGIPLPLPRPTLIRDPSLASYPNSPLANRTRQGSALEAFLAFAQSRNFQRVV